MHKKAKLHFFSTLSPNDPNGYNLHKDEYLIMCWTLSPQQQNDQTKKKKKKHDKTEASDHGDGDIFAKALQLRTPIKVYLVLYSTDCFKTSNFTVFNIKGVFTLALWVHTRVCVRSDFGIFN